MKLFRKQKKAFSLFEIVLYLALFGMVFLTAIQFAFNIMDFNQKAAQEIELEKTIIFATEHLSQTFKNAVTIDAAGSTFNNSNGVLSLTTQTNPIIYSKDQNRLRVMVDGINYYLSSSDMVLSNFYIEKIVNRTDNIVGIRLSLTMYSIKDSSVTKSIQTSYMVN